MAETLAAERIKKLEEEAKETKDMAVKEKEASVSQLRSLESQQAEAQAKEQLLREQMVAL